MQFFYFDFSKSPLICITILRNPETIEELDLFFNRLETLLMQTKCIQHQKYKYIIAMDTSAIDSMLSFRLGYHILQRLNDISPLSKETVQELAVFIPNSIVRQVFQWIVELRNPAVPWTLLSSAEESNQWLNNQMEQLSFHTTLTEHQLEMI